jgi:hypothetical protein
MNAPLRKICVGAEGVGFIIEYRRTADTFRRLPCGKGANSPVRPNGKGWAIARRYKGTETTLWRRFTPWVGSLSKWRRA